MANANVLAQYNQLLDSGAVYGENTLLVTQKEDVHCPCGCKGVAGKAGKFIPGHDARLKGILILAAARGNQIVHEHTEQEPIQYEAMQFAAERNWTDLITRGVELTQAADRRKADAASRALEPKEPKAKRETRAKAKVDKLQEKLSKGFAVGDSGTVTFKGKERRAEIVSVDTVNQTISYVIFKADGTEVETEKQDVLMTSGYFQPDTMAEVAETVSV